MTDERRIFHFEKPHKVSGPWSKWHLCVGGWEISGNSREELKKEALRLLRRELEILEKEGD